MEEKSSVKIAQVIAEQRKAHNMTQKELGDRLNISPQAVSKWENGLAEPDIDTLMKMCKIFGVTLNEMCGQPPETAQDEQTPPLEDPTQNESEPRVILGYCSRCKKPLYHTDEYVVHNRRGGPAETCCKACEKEMRDAHTVSEHIRHQHETKKSFLIGGIAGAVALIVLLIALLVGKPFKDSTGVYIVLAVIGGVAFFTFLTQMFWDDSAVQNIFFFFFKSFRMPGVIFSLSPDGLKFLIFAKILFAILGALASVLFFLIGLIFTPLASLLIFPFALLARSVRGKNLKKAADEVKKQN